MLVLELYRKFETENRKADYGPYNNDISLNKRGREYHKLRNTHTWFI